jgi:hypothetical protein
MALRIDDLSIDYDHSDDVLYISVGKPREALTFEERDGLLVRKDPATGDAIAVTVLQYETHFRRLEDVSWLEQQHLPPTIVRFLNYRPSIGSL